MGWQIDATLVTREKKIWLGCFPAIMHPKPIFRRLADLFFDNIVCFRSQRFHGGTGGIESIGKNHSPACALLRVNSGGDDCGTSASGKQGRKRRSRSKAAAELRPNAAAATVLVAQTTRPA